MKVGKRQNLVRKYAGKEAGDLAESMSWIAGGLGAAVIASQLATRITPNENVSKATGLVTAATFGFAPFVAYAFVFAPSLIASVRGRLA
jgi:hypothetical protein